ncbi:DUF2269 domain-containing protein [Streptomyces purpurogeneiscleroticus]|uniref:DUF2269 domain-containing protein n=1 Tax=Streptomyces purpurogeneiscleroticus TaxID=68259 RepID=UPI001CBE02D0|nr:DUF2269 domain-containing protein [Streptomyces purpurogeneiscleroticus]MBZ4018281.1 DUF2269 domain-containing protein [Streptomyces purpurogeneiscleroticus]
MQQLSRPARRATLVVHVVVSVGWLGLTLGLLALGIAASTAGGAAGSDVTSDLAAAAYRSMKIFIDWLIIPLALLTLVSGLVLSLGTPWGLARHRWVVTKFWLTLGAVVATTLALRTQIGAAAGAVTAGRPVPPETDLVVAPAVALALYVFLTAISVLKPWGPTARGRRLREERGRRPERARRAVVR